MTGSMRVCRWRKGEWVAGVAAEGMGVENQPTALAVVGVLPPQYGFYHVLFHS